MYYVEPQRKQEFTNKFEHQAEIYNQFITVLKSIIPVVSQYNGKVVNVKLLKSFKEVNKDLYINLSGNQVSISTNSTQRMYKHAILDGYGNIDVSRIEFTLSVDDNKRLDSAKSIETIQGEIEYLTSEIIGITMDISVNYDEEVKAYKKLKKEIAEYNNRFSSRLKSRYIRID